MRVNSPCGLLLGVILSTLAPFTWAQKDRISSVPEPVRDDLKPVTPVLKPEPTLEQVPEAAEPRRTLSVDEAELLAQPALLTRALQSSLIHQNMSEIELLLPLYRRLDNPDTVLLHYASALADAAKEQYHSAIEHYRVVLAQKPELSIVRFGLAMALFYDNQRATALYQFKKLRSETLPESIEKTVSSAIEIITKEQSWAFSINAYGRFEDNINNAPPTRSLRYGSGTLTFDEPEQARGLHIDLGAYKRWYFKRLGRWFVPFSAGLSSDYFWHKHQYNDTSLNLATGMGYHAKRWQLTLKPFVRERFYANTHYSLTRGVKSQFSYFLTLKWQLGQSASWGREVVKKEREHLSGERRSLGASISYQHNARQAYQLGANYFYNGARDGDDRFDDWRGFIVMGQEWRGGLSAQLMLASSWRYYQGYDFFNIKRKDTTLSGALSLWHRAFGVAGLTPKLVVQWSKTDSNHFYYDDRRSKNLRLELSRQF